MLLTLESDDGFPRLESRILAEIEAQVAKLAGTHGLAGAVIRGYCMGGGLDLALACHTRIASSDAVFAHPGGSLGIIIGWGICTIG